MLKLSSVVAPNFFLQLYFTELLCNVFSFFPKLYFFDKVVIIHNLTKYKSPPAYAKHWESNEIIF